MSIGDLYNQIENSPKHSFGDLILLNPPTDPLLYEKILVPAMAIAERQLSGLMKKVARYQALVMVPPVEVHVERSWWRSSEKQVARAIVKAVSAAIREQIISLNLGDRVSLGHSRGNIDKLKQNQVYYEIARDLSEKVIGDSAGLDWGKIQMTNAFDVLRLWSEQFIHGNIWKSLYSVANPLNLFLTMLGTLMGDPVESAKVRGGKLEKVGASGHGFNALPVILGVAGLMSGGTIPMIAGGIAGVVGLLHQIGYVAQATSGKNSPAHELVHAIQFLVLGEALNQKIIDARDYYDIQNDTSTAFAYITGYLWGGKTEQATEKGEFDADLNPLFEALRTLGTRHLTRKFGKDEKKGKRSSKAFVDVVNGMQTYIEARYGQRLAALKAS